MKRFLFAALLSAPLFFAGCGDKVKPGANEVERREITGVKVSLVTPSEQSEVLEVSGTIKAKTVSAVASKVMGTVTSVKVEEGDYVRKGALLLTIEDADIAEKENAAKAGLNEAKAALESAKANLTLLNTTYGRYKKLYESKAISGQEFDNIGTQRKTAELEHERMQAAVKRAEAGAKEARAYRGYARVTAPVSGIVSEKRVDEGGMAVPGAPLLVIEDNSSYTLEADVDEKLSSALSPGMALKVTIGSLGKDFDAVITQTVPSVNPASRSFLVKASIKGEGLRSGLYARVGLPTGKKMVLTVPASAVVNKGQLTGVYTVDEKGVASYRLIRTGSRYGDAVEALSGLSRDERIITEGADKAFDGGVVK